MRHFALAFLLILVACSATDTPATSTAGIERGVGLSPSSFEEADFLAFLDLIDDGGGTLALVGDWDQLDDPNSAFETVAQIGSDRGHRVLIVAAPNRAGVLLRPLDEQTTARYVAELGTYVGRHDVQYVGLGNEVNLLAVNDPPGFEAFVELFAAAQAAVREASPDTVVFPVLQYEWLIGDRSGLYGGSITDPQWELLGRFAGADAIGLTSYPGLVFTDPRDLPDDYYARLAEQVNIPVVFTEVGWHAGSLPRGWESSEDEQAEFVDRFFQLTSDLDVVLAVWPFVFDTLVVDPPFDTMGLWRSDGTARPAWERWIADR